MGIVVTLSRELGSGGERIACEVAEALHLRCLGSDLIHEAMRAGIPEDIALESEEGRQSFIQRAADFLRGSPSVPAPVTLTGTEPMSTHLSTDLPQTDDDYYRAILESLIFDLAQKEHILLIGRAGQVIFRNQPHAFHIRTVAPLEKRIQVVAERLKIRPEEARKKIQSTDEARAAYLKRHYHADITDCSLYDLTLNTGTIPHEAAVKLILDAIRAALKLP